LKRDELIFGTGAIVALGVNALLTWWHPPWWTALITFPVGVWYVVRIILGWRTELHQRQKDI